MLSPVFREEAILERLITLSDINCLLATWIISFFQIGYPSEFGAMVRGSSGLMTFFPFNQQISGYFTPMSLHSAQLSCKMVYILVVRVAL